MSNYYRIKPLAGLTLAGLFVSLVILVGAGEAAPPAEPLPTPTPTPIRPPFFPRPGHPITYQINTPTTYFIPLIPESLLPISNSHSQTSPPPDSPDLSVRYIHRDPAYRRYCVDYQAGRPYLCPGSEHEQRWPAPGEPVTYTAYVANVGNLATGPFTFTWTLNGQPVQTGLWRNLAPGAEITLTLATTWPASPPSADQTIALRVGLATPYPEITLANNTLTDAIHALSLDVLVHPYVYDAFAVRPNLRGSWSFEDWFQAQLAQMNQRLAAAIYPVSPAGIPDRVRLDRLTVGLTRNSDTSPALATDGSWTFWVADDNHHSPVDESRLSAENYATFFSQTIDWGLIHELTHQLGVIDLYQIGLSAPLNDQLLGADGLPLLMGTRWPHPGLMAGGDVTPYPDSTYYSSHTAGGLVTNSGDRRGYYGEYLFDLPHQIALDLRDNRGNPLAGATLRAYQVFNPVIDPTPVFTVTSDHNGHLHLPNRPVGAPVTTATGHTLRDNPFGLIDVVGRNGLLLLRLSRDGFLEDRWLDITEPNLAYWSGQTETYTITWTTRLPGPGAPWPPPQLTGRVSGGQVTLQWPASPSANVTAYRIYRGEEPTYTLSLIATVSNTQSPNLQSPPLVLPTTSRFAVTAVDAAGRESGPSPLFRAFRWVIPQAAVFISQTTSLPQPGQVSNQGYGSGGKWVILDGHYGALVTQTPDGRSIGAQGSEHLRFVGAQQINQNRAGQIVLAGPGRVEILDDTLRRISRFGSPPPLPGDYAPIAAPILGRVTGAALAGETFRIDLVASDDAATGFLAHFDGNLLSRTTRPLTATHVTFAPGYAGQGVSLTLASELVYPGTAILTATGSVEFWFRPDWPADSNTAHTFLEAGDQITYRLRLGWLPGGYTYAAIDSLLANDPHHYWLWADVSNWQAGEWHHLAFTWQSDRVNFFVDGRLADGYNVYHAITGTITLLRLGNSLDGTEPATGILDELRISTRPRLGNSDRVEVWLAEIERRQLLAFDLLGQPLSKTIDLAGLSDRPGQLAVDSTGRLAVSDRAAHQVLVFRPTATGLALSQVISAGLNAPAGLAFDRDGSLVIADSGHDRLVVIDARGERIAVYDRPDDGSGGTFRQPESVAIGPAGEYLVLDTGNERVARVWRPGRVWQTFLPIARR